MDLSSTSPDAAFAKRRIDPALWREARAQHPPPLDPDEYTLRSPESFESPLVRRLRFHLSDLGNRNGVSPQSALLTTAIHPIWANVQYFREAGPAVMCDTQVFLGALRRLVDRCLIAIGTTDTIRLAPSDETTALLKSLYPDAAISDVLPEGSRESTIEPIQTSVRRSKPKLAFVLGSGRSGTTWLTRMLQMNTQVAGLGDHESWVFELLAPLWQLTDQGRLGQLTTANAADYVGEFSDALFDAACDRYNSSAVLFVEKTPGHAHLVPFLRAVYPDAHYLHLIRDGRDVARSLSRLRFTWYPDPADAAGHWASTLRVVREEARSLRMDRFREVRYEALRAQPLVELEQLWMWLGVATDSTTRSRVSEIAAERVSTWSGTEIPLGAQSWRALSRRDLARVYARIGKVLVAEGYVTRAELLPWRFHPSYVVARSRAMPAAAVRRMRA